MNKKELKQLCELSLKIHLKTGILLKKYQKKLSSLQTQSKKAQGVFTEADLKAEELIRNKILKYYPSHHFLGEESSYGKYKSKKDMKKLSEKYEYLWIVDPLDGTNNFLNGSDYYAISMGLLHKGEVIFGMVSRPNTGECFYAYTDYKTKYIQNLSDPRPRNIFINNNKKKLKESILVTGFAAEKESVRNIEFSRFKKLMGKTRGIRRFGSAALDLCYVASGLWDGFWEYGLAPWDTTAAQIICENAGAIVVNYKDQEFSPFNDTIKVARSPLAKEFFSQVK